MNKTRRLFLLALAALILATCLAPLAGAEGDKDAPPEIEVKFTEISKYGNIVLSVSPDALRKLGYEPGDIIRVQWGDCETQMPIGTSYSDVDAGEAICCYKMSASKGIEEALLAINGGDLTSTLGIGTRRKIDKEPGFTWDLAEGLSADTPITLSMLEKQGYAEEYALHQITGSRSNNREDFPDLSDAEYANFRAIETSGMGKGTLYRSSSPINPGINRSKEADEALLEALIRTVVNMADSEEAMEKYADYRLTHYADCDIIALNMVVDFTSEDYQKDLAEGVRFILDHEGPYLLHCNEGKDRTGFAAAMLECLMGAGLDEVVADYMLSYYNYYGVEPDTEVYTQIAEGNIEVQLAKAFALESIRDKDVDLQKCAETWLEGIGLSKAEIAALKAKLAEDYGGMELTEKAA